MIQPRPLRLLAALILPIVLAAPLRGQDIPPVGTDATLDVATWNIEWFGSPNQGPSDVQRQFASVRAIIERSEIDLWGVQEISNPTLFQALLDSLGDGYDGSLATYSQQQKIGFIYRRDVVRSVSTPRHILTQYAEDEFAGRPPLEFVATVTLPDTSFEATFITLHMKAMSDRPSYDRRLEAARRLKNQLDVLYARDPVIILGDFNDRLMTSITGGRSTPYQRFLDDAARYRFITYEAEERGEVSFIGYSRSMIDHILITDELFDAYAHDSARPWSELTTMNWNYDRTVFGSAISDHVPVIARFDFTTSTSAAYALAPDARSLRAPYPNPARDHVAVRYELDRGADVRLELFDVAGRRLATIEEGVRFAGRFEVRLPVAELPPGMYLIRLMAGDHMEARTLAVVR